MEIRPAIASDLDAIGQLSVKLHAESPTYREIPIDPEVAGRTVQRLLSDPNLCTVMAFRDGRPVGIGSVALMPLMHARALRAEDVALYVVPEERRSGAGAGVSNALDELAKQKGAQFSTRVITSGIDMPRTVQFYESLGYELLGYVMHKRL